MMGQTRPPSTVRERQTHRMMRDLFGEVVTLRTVIVEVCTAEEFAEDRVIAVASEQSAVHGPLGGAPSVGFSGLQTSGVRHHDSRLLYSFRLDMPSGEVHCHDTHKPFLWIINLAGPVLHQRKICLSLP